MRRDSRDYDMKDVVVSKKIRLAEVGHRDHAKLRNVLSEAKKVGYEPKLIAEQFLWHSVSKIYESENGSHWLSILKDEFPEAFSLISASVLTSNVIYNFDIDSLKILVQHPSFEIFNIPSSFNPLKAGSFCQFHDQFVPLLNSLAPDDQVRIKNEFLNTALAVYSADVNYTNSCHILSSGHRITELALSWLSPNTRECVLSTILAYELESSIISRQDVKEFDVQSTLVSTMSL